MKRAGGARGAARQAVGGQWRRGARGAAPRLSKRPEDGPLLLWTRKKPEKSSRKSRGGDSPRVVRR
jgi:hypothetical protein